jgi:hypothetical protein
MSALGQKQTLHHVRPMSALPPKADIPQHRLDVRFVPMADMTADPRIVKKTKGDLQHLRDIAFRSA